MDTIRLVQCAAIRANAELLAANVIGEENAKAKLKKDRHWHDYAQTCRSATA
jgi:hypothetical protein